MTRPVPTGVLHFTHVDHLADIVRHGLVSDTVAQGHGWISREAGNPDIKKKRRAQRVPTGPGGVVADYVPFYFAPRSPMMFAIHSGRVSQYTGSTHDLVHLASTVERLRDHGSRVVLSDRNAAMTVAVFSEDPSGWDDLVDWPLMREEMWRSTPDDPERRDRRMAECLVHGAVPWVALTDVYVADRERQEQVSAIVTSCGSAIRVHVRPDWYF